MTEEEIKQKFKETYPEYMYGDKPLSPYFDIWCYAIEIMEQENNKLLDVINNQDVKIAGLEKKVNENDICIEDLELSNIDLQKQLEQAKKIIRTFLNMPMPNNEEVFADVGMFLTKAEQFLKEIEK